ncbi:MAG TPA: fibronectin type III domain-containing protein, partial [Symbiobacteriaceae bacterium]|nr:fibronectin type III domain-containing protein [Symbiobacteriaceae bacterium]
PVPACTFDNVQQLAGYTEGLALKTDGTVWAWGAQQGAPYCRKVSGLPTAVAVAASDTDSVVLAADGSVWQWPSVNGIPSLIAPAKVANLPPAASIAAGRSFAVAVTQDGSVYTWGAANQYGQLGQGHFKAGPFGAQQVPGLSGITAVAAGPDFTLALASDGTVWGWGRNNHMWDNTWDSAATPRHLSGLTDVARIAAGTWTGAVTKTDGTVWLWGTVYHNNSSVEPVQVPGLTGAVALSLGYDHLLALMPDGSVLAYGDNYYYELGTGDTLRYEEPVAPLPFALDLQPPTWVNGQVIAEPGEGFIKVDAAGATDDYAVVGYDVYLNGKLTQPDLPVRLLPYSVPGLATDADYTVRLEAIDASGRRSTNGPTATVRTLPDKTPPIWFNPRLNAYTVGQTGMRLIWNPAYGAELGGYRIYANGQLVQDVPYQNSSDMRTDITGLTPDTDYQIQVQAYDRYKNESTDGPTVSVHTLPVRNVAATAATGTYYGLVAGINGDVWGWGDNLAGEISPSAKAGIYQRPFVVAGATDITAVSVGLYHTLALRGDGTVWSWGASDNGRLGRDTRPYPTSVGYVPDLGNIVSVSAGCYHSLAARADGTVWAWGYNAYKQLGDGTTIDRSSPVQVKGLSGVSSVAAGCYYSLALKSDGTVWMWGALSPGVSGASAPASPTRVGSLTNVVAITAGASHALAVTADGSVWAWGTNTSGQIGDGTTTNRWTPVKVGGLTGVSSVAAGAAHSVALKSDGSVWAWGDNSVGQIGDGMPGGIRKAPVSVAVQPVTAIASGSGSNTSLAVGADGAIWAWGAGGQGQLGDDLTHFDYSAVPVQVRFPGTDTTPPTWPDDSALSAPSIRETELTLSWTAALDETAIGHYQIFQNNDLIAMVPGDTTSYTVKGLQSKSAYQFRIAAGDVAGNWTSGPSLAVTTPGKDT